MKASGLSKISVVIGVCLFHLIVAALFYFIVLPLCLPKGVSATPQALAGMRFNVVLAGFVASTIVTLLCVLIAMRLDNGDERVQRVADAVRQPVLVLDDGRVALINSEAERVLGLSRERDLGKAVDSRVKSALAAVKADSEDFNLQACVELGGERYQVFDNALRHPGAEGALRIVMLRNVTGQMRIRDAVCEVNQAMVVLNANTMKISSSALSLSQGATEQASSLATISSSLDEFSKKVQGNTESAAKGTKLAAQAREAAERSGNEITHALSAMTEVQEAGIRIARIVKLIDDIAFQTNLLALNAAVEAARAGRQGKGFAVVADEVRSLAGRSAKAAKDTAGMVEDVTERIGYASEYITKLEEILNNIVHDAIRMADSSASASAISAEQAEAILQVNSELGQMNSLTQNTMSEAEQTATAVEVLARQVETLKQKLDGLAIEFSLDSREPAAQINLTDDFGNLPPLSRGSSYLIDNILSPDRDRAGVGGRPGYGSGTRIHLPHAGAERDRGAGDDFSYTPEGDRVAMPGQNIQLDDSEFGRY